MKNIILKLFFYIKIQTKETHISHHLSPASFIFHSTEVDI